jgi:transcription antitermination factor NusG
MNHEKRVAQHLAVRLQENYLPLYAERSQWTDRVVNLERPLFPGYLFVRFQPEARLSVLSTPGVLRLLGEMERDTVSDAEMDRIREGLASGCLLRPHGGLTMGSPVRVQRGIFAGAEGIVTELHKACRVVLALSATGQSFSLEVDLGDIEVLRSRAAGRPSLHGRALALSGH